MTVSRRQFLSSSVAVGAAGIMAPAAAAPSEARGLSGCRVIAAAAAKAPFSTRWLFVTPRTVRAEQEEAVRRLPQARLSGDDVVVPIADGITATVQFFPLPVFPSKAEWDWAHRKLFSVCLTGAWVEEPNRWPGRLPMTLSLRIGRFPLPPPQTDFRPEVYSPFGAYDFDLHFWRYVNNSAAVRNWVWEGQ